MIYKDIKGSELLRLYSSKIEELSDNPPQNTEEIGALIGKLWGIAQEMRHIAVKQETNEDATKKLLQELVDFHNSSSSLKYVI